MKIPRRVPQEAAEPVLALIEREIYDGHRTAFRKTRDLRELEPALQNGALAFVRRDFVIYSVKELLLPRERELGASWRRLKGLPYLEVSSPNGPIAFRFNKLGPDYLPVTYNDTEQTIEMRQTGFLFPELALDERMPESLIVIGGMYDVNWKRDPTVWAVSIANNDVEWKVPLTGSALRHRLPQAPASGFKVRSKRKKQDKAGDEQ